MNIDSQSRILNAESSLRNKAATPAKGGEELRKQDFMNLFMTQMSHQDPMDPMDSGAMMSQLAQLGSMEQLENMNGQLKEMNATQKEISRSQALGFLDKDVMLEVSDLELARGGSKPVYYSLDQDMDDVKLIIEEMDGAPVFSTELGLVTAGKHQFAWDGKNDEGVLMGDGTYRIKLTGKGPDGSTAELDTFKSGRVSQLEYRKGEPWVKVSGRMIPLSKVSTIDIRSQKLFGDATPLPIMQELAPKTISKLDETEQDKLKTTVHN
jgi:flagellar basal-body rod modification protein FlgD